MDMYVFLQCVLSVYAWRVFIIGYQKQYGS